MIKDVPLPPQEFMDSVAGASTTADEHVEVGKHVHDMVVNRCRVQPTDIILDIGSGCGRVARQFIGEVAGEYHGFDVMLPMVEWCRSNISTQDRRFHFHHADLSNTLYRGGAGDAASYVFPFGDGTFDVVFAASVFTHLMPASARQYALEIFRVLRTNGRALLTFFLVNNKWRQKLATGERLMRFPHEGEGYRTSDLNNPEGVIAFEEADAIRFLVDSGLTIEEISLGTWSGNLGWTGQDAILVSKR